MRAWLTMHDPILEWVLFDQTLEGQEQKVRAAARQLAACGC